MMIIAPGVRGCLATFAEPPLGDHGQEAWISSPPWSREIGAATHVQGGLCDHDQRRTSRSTTLRTGDGPLIGITGALTLGRAEIAGGYLPEWTWRSIFWIKSDRL